LSVPEEEGGFVAAAPVMQVREIFRRFWPYARPYRRWMPLIVLFAALGSAIGAATIWMYKVLVDEVLVPRDFGLLLWVVLAYLGLTLAEGVVSFCDEYLSEWVAGRFIVSLRTDLFRHLQGLSLSFFDRQSLGDMLARLTDDVEEIEELMVSEIASALTYLFQFVFLSGRSSTWSGGWRWCRSSLSRCSCLWPATSRGKSDAQPARSDAASAP
jgi:ABC-type multidrug transport system fused ATPase/permease subunit